MAKVIWTKTVERKVQRDGVVRVVPREVHTMAIPAGQVLFVNNIVGRTVCDYDLAEIEPLGDGHRKLEFKTDSIVTVEWLNHNGYTCENLRFGRSNDWERSAYRGVRTFHNNVTVFPTLAKALFQAGRLPDHVVGGARHYAVALCWDKNGQGKELIVPAQTKLERELGLPIEDSSHAFIVPVSEIDDLLASLPIQN